MRSPWGRTAWWVAGAGWGLGLTVTEVEGSHVRGSVWPAAVVVGGGWMTRRLEMQMLTRVWTGSCWVAASVVARGRCREGGSGCGGWGFLVWVRVWVRAGSFWLPSLLLWCRALCGVVLVVVLLRVVLSFGFEFGFLG